MKKSLSNKGSVASDEGVAQDHPLSPARVTLAHVTVEWVALYRQAPPPPQ